MERFEHRNKRPARCAERLREVATGPVAAVPSPEEHARYNLVYGTGIHACPGRPLATLELVVAMQALLGVTSRIELAPDALPVRETYPLGGWRRMPMRLR